MKTIRLYGVMLLVLSILCTACGKSVTKPQKGVLAVSDIIHNDGTYGFKDVKWKSSMEEVESQFGCIFPEIPYESTEWYMVGEGETPEAFYDYRSGQDYDSVQYIAYKDGKPISIDYHGYTGYVGFEFQPIGLVAVYLYFGTVDDKRDPNLIFSDKKNDIEDLRNTFIDEFEKGSGQTGGKDEIAIGNFSDVATWWYSKDPQTSEEYQVVDISKVYNKENCICILISSSR